MSYLIRCLKCLMTVLPWIVTEIVPTRILPREPGGIFHLHVTRPGRKTGVPVIARVPILPRQLIFSGGRIRDGTRSDASRPPNAWLIATVVDAIAAIRSGYSERGAVRASGVSAAPATKSTTRKRTAIRAT